MAEQLGPHGLVALPLGEAVPGPVPVLVHGEGASRKPALYEVLDDGLLVLDGHILPPHVLVHRYPAVPRDVMMFYQCYHQIFVIDCLSLYHISRPLARGWREVNWCSLKYNQVYLASYASDVGINTFLCS